MPWLGDYTVVLQEKTPEDPTGDVISEGETREYEFGTNGANQDEKSYLSMDVATNEDFRRGVVRLNGTQVGTITPRKGDLHTYDVVRFVIDENVIHKRSPNELEVSVPTDDPEGSQLRLGNVIAHFYQHARGTDKS